MAILILAGVSGSGKTTVARALAAAGGGRFVEGDELHPRANLAKMQSGRALSDLDRWPWIERLRAEMTAAEVRGEDLIVTCSALAREYRRRLLENARHARLVVLSISPETAARRVIGRENHFFPPQLVAEQFEALEVPHDEPGVIAIDADRPLEDVVAEVKQIWRQLRTAEG